MVKELEFKVNGDHRGRLIAIEGEKDIPFEIKRIFYIYDTDASSVRGCHANRNSEFVMICISGKCRVLTDDGKGDRKTYDLDRPDKGIYIPGMYWKEMSDFSEDALLLVLSNEKYDPDEYINSYDIFLNQAEESCTTGLFGEKAGV